MSSRQSAGHREYIVAAILLARPCADLLACRPVAVGAEIPVPAVSSNHRRYFHDPIRIRRWWRGFFIGEGHRGGIAGRHPRVARPENLDGEARIPTSTWIGTDESFQHGEVFVTSDGTEADLDLGHYERFVRTVTGRHRIFTAGRIYQRVIERGAVGITSAARCG